MNKYELLQAVINDLGDENRGVQVRGFRNVKIIAAAVEALAQLKDGLKRDDDAFGEALKQKDEEIARLQARVAELEKEEASKE